MYTLSPFFTRSLFTRFHFNAVIFAAQIPFFTRISHFNAIAFFRFLLVYIFLRVIIFEYNTGKSQQKNVTLCVSIIANLVIMYLVSGRCSCFGKTLKYIYNFVIKIIKNFNKEFQFLLALQWKLIQKKIKNAKAFL